jgi:hypothetical protein
MMRFVKLGTRFINLDKIYQVTFTDNHTTEELVAILDVATPVSMYQEESEDVTGPIESASMHIVGQEAEALRHYLDGRSDQAGKAYTAFLENNERIRKANEKEDRFQAFCTAKELDSEERYSFRYWLQDDNGEPFGWEPTEEAFQLWRKWQSDIFEQHVKLSAIAANVPNSYMEQYKQFCKENMISQPQYYDGRKFLEQNEIALPAPF